MSENYGKMILPNGKYYSLDDFKTRLNNNVLVVGTTGSAKTRTLVIPNLLECVGSYIVTDPKGNLYRQYGDYMKEHGYNVLRISFIHPEESMHYNPLMYIRNTQDINKLSSVIVNTDKKFNSNMDPYWDKNAMILLNSIIGYILETQEPNSPTYTINFLQEKLRECNQTGDSSTVHGFSIFEQTMKKLKRVNPNSWACKQFDSVKLTPPKTFNCITSTAISKMGTFDSDELNMMMSRDDMDFSSIGKEKTALFVEVSDSDRSLDFLVNIFFTQAMNELCNYADKCDNSRLPVPVRFIMDDFATNCRIDNFENMISNIRSRKISTMIVLQSLSQLNRGYGTSANTIIDNCDTQIYMGGNDINTAQTFGIRCNKTVQTMLQMPIRTSWIMRRGEKPVMCKNFELDDYLKKNKAYNEIMEK